MPCQNNFLLSLFPYFLISLSPYLLISLYSYILIFLFPPLLIFLSPYILISSSPYFLIFLFSYFLITLYSYFLMLHRNSKALDTFSMSSMTDVIFLLLIFFMVTSTLVFPAAVDVNLPQSGEEAPLRPTTEVYIDAEENIYLVERNDSVAGEPRALTREELVAALRLEAGGSRPEAQGPRPEAQTNGIALYADSTVKYARVVEVLDLAARNGVRLVLATRAK